MANHISACFNLGILWYLGYLRVSKISTQRTRHVFLNSGECGSEVPYRDGHRPAGIDPQILGAVAWGPRCAGFTCSQGLPSDLKLANTIQQDCWIFHHKFGWNKPCNSMLATILMALLARNQQNIFTSLLIWGVDISYRLLDLASLPTHVRPFTSQWRVLHYKAVIKPTLQAEYFAICALNWLYHTSPEISTKYPGVNVYSSMWKTHGFPNHLQLVFRIFANVGGDEIHNFPRGRSNTWPDSEGALTAQWRNGRSAALAQDKWLVHDAAGKLPQGLENGGRPYIKEVNCWKLW